MEAALDAMHFERPAYSGGEVALVTDVALPVAVDVSIVIEGDFMSIEEPVIFRRRIEAGARRITIAATEDLPADFRHFAVSLSSSGFVAKRVFGVEICHAERQGRAPAVLADRIGEALEQVANFAEADTVRALARLATGRGGAETDAMIAAALPAIEDCHDCADFILVPLLWCRRVYGDSIAVDLRRRIDAAILNYRYWMDEPGNDVQWYFSENHALLFHTAAYLGGHLLPEARFVRSGRTGAEQSAVGLARVRAWLDHFEDMGNGGIQLRPLFPDRSQGIDDPLRAWRQMPMSAGAPGLRSTACSRSSPAPLSRACLPARRDAPTNTRCAPPVRWNFPALRACCGARVSTACASTRCRSLRSACATMASTSRKS